jgi:hypothetical protein
MSVQVGKHLLASKEALIDKENYCYRFVSKRGIFFDGLFYGSTAMLSIVDDELILHVHMENPKSFIGLLVVYWCESHGSID